MLRKLFRMGPSDAEKQELDNQRLLRLNDYIAKNGVQVVASDSFTKCELEKEEQIMRDLNRSIILSNNLEQKRILEAQKEQLLRKEFFFKVGENKFVSLGNVTYLDFDRAHISNIIGLNSTLSDYKKQGSQFMNNYLYSRDARTTVNPEEDETNTLLKTFLRAAKQKRDERAAKEDEAYRSSQNEKRWNESDWDYARRIGRNERELADQELVDPKNCSRNFPLYLSTPVDAIIGIGAQHRGKTIYKFLVDSLGSIEDGFAKQFRNQNAFENYDNGSRQQMARYALQPAVKQGFIRTLCESRVALQILGTANREDIGGGQSYYQTSQHDTYTLNAWRALRLCLEQLEIYILNETLPQFAPPSSAPIPAPSLDYGGGKLKSRSKSIRKKRISHRKKKSHSHKRRTPKRRAPKRRTVNQ
jgi:hypothetical protein